jgi:Cohesin domain
MSSFAMRFLVLASAMSLLLAFAAGCGSDAPKKKSAAGPAPAGTSTTDASRPGPIVFLRERTGGEAHVTVDVVVQGAERAIHGAAFRLHWDPEKLALAEAHASDAWSRSSVQLAKEGVPGELVVVWTEKGSAAAVKTSDETILGSIDFTVKSHEGAAVEFRPARSTVQDAEGVPLTVEWRNGRISAR